MYKDDYLYHHGIKGQKWGVRRYRNEDGSLTSAGKKRYYTGHTGIGSARKNHLARINKRYDDVEKTYADSYEKSRSEGKSRWKSSIDAQKSAKAEHGRREYNNYRNTRNRRNRYRTKFNRKVLRTTLAAAGGIAVGRALVNTVRGVALSQMMNDW